MYETLIRPLIFRMAPEKAHWSTISAAAGIGFAAPLLRAALAVDDSRLKTTVAGLDFATPIGLSAGFDKSGQAVRTLAALGFGYVEIGSVSADPSPGNAAPRLWRLPDDEAVLVAYGVPNDGADAVAARLRDVTLPVPLGINIVKTNHGSGSKPETDDAIIAEYVRAATTLAPQADYLMFNLSCPNTHDGRDFFADRGRLRAWLEAMSAQRLAPPVFLKVSPLGGIANVEQLLEVAEPFAFVRGFMFNLPLVKPERHLRSKPELWRERPGAISGPPSAPLLDECLRECYRRMDRKRYRLFASGGVSSGADAYAKIRMGASLVSLYTALVFHGPLLVTRITRELSALLARDGFANVADAVGADMT